MKKATIKIRRKYHDLELKRLVYGGETIEVSLERAETLCSKGLADVIEVNHYTDGLQDIAKTFDVNLEATLNPITFENDKEIVKNYVANELSRFKLSELKQIAKEKDIKTTGLKKQELIDKILET